jgi:hypothetical protein
VQRDSATGPSPHRLRVQPPLPPRVLRGLDRAVRELDRRRARAVVPRRPRLRRREPQPQRPLEAPRLGCARNSPPKNMGSDNILGGQIRIIYTVITVIIWIIIIYIIN